MNDTGDDRPSLLPEDVPFESGFNWKTVWAALFVGFVMMPGAIYLGLVSGQSVGGAANWVTIILFIEIAKRTFVRLKPQEIIIIFSIAAGLVGMAGRLGSGAMLFGGPFGSFIWDQYFIQSPQAADIASGLREGVEQFKGIPNWVVPPRGSEALAERTFWHSAWIKPIYVLASVIVMGTITNLSFGYVLFRWTSDVERLPFPMAPVHASGALALAETSNQREGWRWRVFTIGSIVGVMFGLIYIGLPVLSSVFLTETLVLLPPPFIDLTTYLSRYLPATPIAIGSDLGLVLAGFVLPFWVIVGTFAAAMLMTFAGLPMLHHYGVLTRWNPGMSYIPTAISNNFDFWISFFIGTSLVIFLLGVGATIRALAKRRGAGVRRHELPAGRGDIRICIALAIWLLATVGIVALCKLLVPGFPWWVLAFFGFVWTPINSYINSRMIGITGTSGQIQIPYLREASFYLTGYNKGVDIWFAPIPLSNYAWRVQQFRQLELTRTRFGSMVKATAVALVVTWFCSFLYWSWIWKLGPIPSSTYPYVQRMWPMFATTQAMWLRTTLPGGQGVEYLKQIIHPEYIAVGFAVGVLVYAAFAVIGLPTIMFYGFVTGMGRTSFTALPMFLGAMLGRFYFSRRFGPGKWRSYSPILLAGFGCGTGLVGITSVAIKLIASAVKQVVF